MNRNVLFGGAQAGRLLAWYYASAPQVLVDASGNVSLWRDRSPSGNLIFQVTAGLRPAYESSGGWDGSHPSVNYPGSTHELTASAGSLARLRGSFAALITFQNNDVVDNTNVLAWHNAGATQWTAIRTAASGGNAFIRVERFDGTSLGGATGTIALGSGHRRVAVSFDGTRVTTWIDAVMDLNASSLTLTGAAQPATDNFTLGWNGNPFSPACRFTEIQIYANAITQSIVNSYQASSLANWGA